MNFENATPRPWTKTQYGELVGSNGLRVIAYDLGVALVMSGPDDEERDNGQLIVTAVNAHDSLLRELTKAREIVEKWCHYQGNSPALFDEYLTSIDAALKLARAES